MAVLYLLAGGSRDGFVEEKSEPVKKDKKERKGYKA